MRLPVIPAAALARHLLTRVAVPAAATAVAAAAVRAQTSPPPTRPSAAPGKPVGAAAARSAPRAHGAAPVHGATRTRSAGPAGGPATFQTGDRAVRVEPGAAGTVLFTLTAGGDMVRLVAPRSAVRAGARRTRAVMTTDGCNTATGVRDGGDPPDFQAVVQGTAVAVPIQFDCFAVDAGPHQSRPAARVWLQRSGRPLTAIQKLDLAPAQMTALLTALEGTP